MSKLIGNNPNQVSSNADLGSAAFLDKKEILLAKGSSLSAIDSVINKTAVNVFIYDTSKDSDGGAWRRRTQNTSWYNEPLNTATRGSKKEFPSVAVIVCANDSTMTIYDADDASLPMWMVFRKASGQQFFFDATTPTSVVAVNGTVFVCGGNGSLELSFISERNRFRSTNQQYNSGNIANRNNVSGGNSWHVVVGSGVLSSTSIRDCHMVVRPNARVDEETGLPTPTIIVSTSSGVNVILDDKNRTIADWSGLSQEAVLISEDKVYIGYGGNGRIYVDPIPKVNTLMSGSLSTLTERHYRALGGSYFSDDDLYYLSAGEEIIFKNKMALAGKNKLVVGTSAGMTLINENADVPNKGMVAYIASDYNTGWMPGDVRFAGLSSTENGAVISSINLVQNSNFDGGTTTGWSPSGSTLSVVSGAIRVTNTEAYGKAVQNIPVIPGKTYTFRFDCIGGTAPQAVIQVGAPINKYEYVQFGQKGLLTFKVPDGVTSVPINLQTQSATVGHYADFDNVTVYLSEENRTRKRYGVGTFIDGNATEYRGTLIKTKVAPGSDLVAFTGFTSINNLVMYDNQDMEIGTSDFYIMGWMKLPQSGVTRTMFHAVTPSDGELLCRVESTNFIRMYINDGSSQTFDVTTSRKVDNTWQHYCVVRRGPRAKIYINGEEAGSTINENFGSFLATKPTAAFGARSPIAASPTVEPLSTGSLALWKFGLTEVSEEDILKIYKDERALFNPNAKATLYGDSNTVYAVAYDEDTKETHAGTVFGRSTFNGLIRTSNTTNPVGVAISASNGLVVEE